MQPVKFKESNLVLNPAPGTEDTVLPLHVYFDGQRCISKWEFTQEEIDELVKNKGIYIEQWAGRDGQPPILPMVHSPFIYATNSHSYSMCLYEGESELMSDVLLIQNPGDIEIPQVITVDGKIYYFSKSKRVPLPPLDKEMLYFRLCNDYEAVQRIGKAIDEFDTLVNQGNFTGEDREHFIKEIPERARRVAGLFRRKSAGKDELIC